MSNEVRYLNFRACPPVMIIPSDIMDKNEWLSCLFCYDNSRYLAFAVYSFYYNTLSIVMV
jgi:hypothetical protein